MKHLLAAATLFAVPCSAQSAQTCLVLNNAWYTPAQNYQISVEVDGYPGHYWRTTYNQTFAVMIEPDNHATLLRGDNFVLHLYAGDQGRTGQFIGDARSIDYTNAVPNTNPHVLWTYVKPNDEFSRRWAECASSGVWLALIHG